MASGFFQAEDSDMKYSLPAAIVTLCTATRSHLKPRIRLSAGPWSNVTRNMNSGSLR